jgi:hypothetical protein
MATGSFKNWVLQINIHMFLWGKTRYGDIRPTGRKVTGAKLQIFVPHGNEFIGTKHLVERLQKEFHTKQVDVFDSRKRILETSKKLTNGQVGKEYNSIRAAMFILEDKWLRLEHIANVLGGSRDTALLELHCLDKDYRDDQGFENAQKYRRLNGTRILLPTDSIVNEYYEPIVNNLEFLHKYKDMSAYLVDYFTELGTRWRNINRDMVNDLLGTVTTASSRFVIIEIPAGTISKNSLGDVKLRSDFEKEKLKRESVCSELSEEEISAVISIFNKRIIWPEYAEQSEIRGPGDWTNVGR